ncbi:MAG: hypothetical protein ACYS0G_11045 [Planctomycetota bacterium]|jgi:hypothetical protein
MDEDAFSPDPWPDPVMHLSTVGDYQRPQPSQAAEGTPQDAAAGTPNLEDRLERLALICMAMWSLIQSETNLTEEDLLARVGEIDMMDGQADGKITRRVTRCGQCDRPMSSRHTRCIYCGSEHLAASAFDTV